VLIVGSGPAGASLAYYLAKKNLKVLLVEKKKHIDSPVRCAEFVSLNIASLFDFKIAGINNQTEILETYIAGNKNERFNLVASTPSPGFILDREIFIRDLVQRFKEIGGILATGTKFVALNSAMPYPLSAISGASPGGYLDATLADVDTGKLSNIKSFIIAWACGPLLSGISPGKGAYMYAIQQNLPVKSQYLSVNRVYFAPYIYGGYGWIFPKTASINLGIGKASAQGLKHNLEAFKKHLYHSGQIPEPSFYRNLGNNKNNAVTGLAPVSGIAKNPATEKGGIFVGDAAGLCNPVTGAGIVNAIRSAKLASERIFQCLKQNDLNILLGVKTDYEKEFGKSIERALGKRKYMLDNWQNTAIAFPDLIRQTWVAFKDYWKQDL